MSGSRSAGFNSVRPLAAAVSMTAIRPPSSRAYRASAGQRVVHEHRPEGSAQASDEALSEAFAAIGQRHPADVASLQCGSRGIHRLRSCQTALE